MKATFRLTAAAFVLAAFNLSAATLYVWLESANPIVPYATWATAATNIQDAVDAAKAGDTVQVTNGVYCTGSRGSPYDWGEGDQNRVAITNAIRLESVNGPLATIIEGGQFTNNLGEVTNRIRCVFLGPNAVISGFTLTKGCQMGRHHWGGGGGVRSDRLGIVTNCVLTGNLAHHGGGVCGGTLYDCQLESNATTQTPWGEYGGGASDSTLYRCTLTGNSAAYNGGGAAGCTLFNCVLMNNWAWGHGGGAYYSVLYNCIVKGNFAELGGGSFWSTLFNCTVTVNSAGSGGGGVDVGFLYNCIVYYNSAPGGANYFTHPESGFEPNMPLLLNRCCTTPLPTNGVGNITLLPLFMDITWDDLRLREDSPCIDAGMNLTGFSATITNDLGGWEEVTYRYEPTDILGNTRFIDGNGDGVVAWDIGAYEFNSFKPPRFTSSPQHTAEGWKLTITGATNKWIHLQRNDIGLNADSWNDVWPPVFMGVEGIRQLTDTDTGQRAMAFYRVIVLQ